ncbi:MAG: hypothetical protein LBU37_08035 [Tannerellaceae bacterium]|jgi:hypothetical protein|nr:hypothetical protein [Tannerellaceae bacterium]
MWTIEKYKEIYARYKARGLTSKDFYLNEGITRSRFFYWRKKYRRLPKRSVSIVNNTRDSGITTEKEASDFIPIVFVPENSTTPKRNRIIQREENDGLP